MNKPDEVASAVERVQKRVETFWRDELGVSGLPSEDRYAIAVAAAAVITRSKSDLGDDELITFVGQRIADEEFRLALEEPSYRDLLCSITRDIRAVADVNRMAVFRDVFASLIVFPAAAVLGEDASRLAEKTREAVTECLRSVLFEAELLGMFWAREAAHAPTP